MPILSSTPKIEHRCLPQPDKATMDQTLRCCRDARGWVSRRIRRFQSRRPSSCSMESSCICPVTSPGLVKLHGLLPKQEQQDTPCLKTRFLNDPKYAMWKLFYSSACENIEVRQKETPLSLERCSSTTTHGLDTEAVPSYLGMASCCVTHHVEHAQNSLEISHHVCEIEHEAAVVYAEWLAEQAISQYVPVFCCLKEAEMVETYIQDIRARSDKIKMARLAYTSTQQYITSHSPSDRWMETSLLRRFVLELPYNRVEELFTPFSVKNGVSTTESQQEQARLSQLSRHERELEKVLPERIEFLRCMYETYKSGANDQGRKIEHEYQQHHEQREDREDVFRRYSKRSRRPHWMDSQQELSKPVLRLLHGGIPSQGPPYGTEVNGRLQDCVTRFRPRNCRRTLQEGQYSSTLHREKRGAVLTRESVLPRSEGNDIGISIDAFDVGENVEELSKPGDGKRRSFFLLGADAEWN